MFKRPIHTVRMCKRVWCIYITCFHPTLLPVPLRHYHMASVKQLPNQFTYIYMKFFIIEVPRSRCYGSTSTLKAYCATLWWRWLFLFWFSILMEHRNRSTRRKTCPTAALSTTNPSCTDPGWNPGLRGERPATNRLSHGTGYIRRYRIVDCLTIYIIRAEAKERSAITYYFEFSSSVIIKPRTLWALNIHATGVIKWIHRDYFIWQLSLITSLLLA